MKTPRNSVRRAGAATVIVGVVMLASCSALIVDPDAQPTISPSPIASDTTGIGGSTADDLVEATPDVLGPFERQLPLTGTFRPAPSRGAQLLRLVQCP